MFFKKSNLHSNTYDFYLKPNGKKKSLHLRKNC